MPTTISREERNMLRDNIARDEIECVSFAPYGREKALNELQRAQIVCALLDDIGWNERGHDDSYEITVNDAQFALLLRRQLDLAHGLLEDNLYSLHLYDGEPDREIPAELRSCVESSREEVSAFRALIQRLDEQCAVA